MENFENNEDLEIEISSTTLGNPNQEGGKVGAIQGLLQEVISKDKYTDTVVRNALIAKDITEEIIPEAEFGVSILASSINPNRMKDLIKSIDYPYYVKLTETEFFEEKLNKVKQEGYTGLGQFTALGQEYAYALLQAHSENEQKQSVEEAGNISNENMLNIRTCIETISINQELRKIKEVNTKLKTSGKDIIWVVEPNKKVGNGTYVDFLNNFENIKNDYQNKDLHFGIDLDIGGLPKEKYEDLLQLIELSERYDKKMLPLLISLSGKDYTESSVRTHLALGEDREFNRKIGEWYKDRKFKGYKLPGIVIETSPSQSQIFKDYTKFLESFKNGFR